MRVIPECSVDGQRLAERMRGIPCDEAVTYAELSMVIGRNVQHEGRSALNSARRQLQREAAMVFAPVRNVGMQRLTDVAIVRTSQASVRHIHRTARKGAVRLGCVANFDGLTNDERVRHNTALSLLGVFYEITKVKSVKQLEAAVAVAQKILPLAQTLAAFRI